MKKLLAAVAAACLMIVPATSARAGLLALFGDVNSTSGDSGVAGRAPLLSNLLGSGTRVLESRQNSEYPSVAVANYYATLSGVTSTVTGANIDSALLSNVDLLFLNLGCCYNAWANSYSASEVSAIAAFLQSGGRVGILQEPCCTDTAAVAGMNALLGDLGSSMRFTGWVGSYGAATVLPGALSAGVTSYELYTFGNIVGGNAVVQVGNNTGIAYEDIADVPEPAMLGLFGLGAIGLGLARRRKTA